MARTEEKIRNISKELRQQRQQECKETIKSFIEQVYEMRVQRRAAEAATLCRRAARCNFAPKKRDGRRLGPAPLSKAQWLGVWTLNGADGGMKVRELHRE